MPLLTSIIATYRRPHSLKRTIASVLAQSFQDFELHVWDDASGDETADVVQSFAKNDPRIHYHLNPRNLGSVANMQQALGAVATPLYHMVSDDNIILPGLYEDAVTVLQKEPDLICSAHTVLHRRLDGTLQGAPLAHWRQGRHEAGEGALQFLAHEQPEWDGMVFRSAWIAESGGLRPQLTPAVDVDYNLRAFIAHPIHVSHRAGAMFSLHPGQESACFLRGRDVWLPLAAQLKQELPPTPLADHIRARLEERARAGVRADIRDLLRTCGAQAALDYVNALSAPVAAPWPALVRALAACPPCEKLYRAAVLMKNKARPWSDPGADAYRTIAEQYWPG